MHKLGAVLPSRHLLLLLVDPHRHAASRAKQKHLNTNNNNNHPKQSFSLGFSTLREKFFFKLRSRFLISQEKLFCVLENVLPYINLPLGPNRISKTEERPKATEKKDLLIFFLNWPLLLVNPQKLGASTSDIIYLSLDKVNKRNSRMPLVSFKKARKKCR